MDTDVKNISGYDDINPIVQPFLKGDRKRDTNNFGPRVGFAWTSKGGDVQLHGGYGIYYDRVTLEIISLERGLDGRALPIEVRAGNVFFLDPNTGSVPPFAPTFSNPFTGLHPARGPGPAASTSSTTASRTPPCSSSTWAPQLRLPRPVDPAGGPRPQPRHALHHRPDDRRGLQPRGGRTRQGREPRVERGHAVRRPAHDPGEALGPGPAASPGLHPLAGPELRQRRPDPLQRRAPRPQRPGEGVRPDPERAAAPLRPLGLLRPALVAAPLAASGPSPPACPWTS